MNEISCSELISYVKNYISGVTIGQKIYLCVMSVLIFVIMLWALRYQAEKMTWWKVICMVALAVFVSIISTVTLTGRNPKEEARWMWQPLWSYVTVIQEQNSVLLMQILWNIIIFIPIGLLMPICFSVFQKYRYIFLIVFIVSVTIEIAQGIGKIGLFEVDDVMNNLLGTVIGVGVYSLGKKLKCKCKW